MRSNIVLTLAMACLAAPLWADEPDLVIADFEGETYGSWKVTGEAFGPGPARGTLPNQMHVEGYEGKGLVNSFFHGDRTTGTLTSPEFTIGRKYLNFLIGGGKHENQTCINLIVDGKTVRTETGPNDKAGGTERLEWQTWDVGDLNGKTATLQIVDTATGGWGHINVDHILQSNTRRGAQLVRREFVIVQDYLLLPVKNGAAKRRMKFLVDDKTVREFEIELADQKADFFVTADVRPFRRQTLTVEFPLPYGSNALAGIQLASSLPRPVDGDERRPRFHFTSHRGWLNDPNGLVYFQGEWHLFYQHNPYGWNWGNMHWGHAVSRDLLQWQELPTALYPREWGDWAFSGSAVVDHQNTSGFKTGEEPALVAAYTSTGRGECIAFSNDRGRTWTEYDKNPVVKHAGRDPKIIWHEPTERWVMAVYDEPAGAERGIAFYSSPDLKAWTFTSRIPGFYECPDLFPLGVDGDQAKLQWILYGADGKYLVGDFDGKEFRSKSPRQQVWYGNFYAAQTFSDAPRGRRVQIGWANGITFPGQPFNQQMTIPVELTLKSGTAGPQMKAWPVEEVSKRREWRTVATTPAADGLQLESGKSISLLAGDGQLDLFDLTCEIDLQQTKKLTLTVCGAPVVYDSVAQTLSCRQVSAPVRSHEGKLSLRILGDRGSLEVFAQHGDVAMSVGYSSAGADRSLKIMAEEGAAMLRQVQIADMKRP